MAEGAGCHEDRGDAAGVLVFYGLQLTLGAHADVAGGVDQWDAGLLVITRAAEMLGKSRL